MFGSSWFKSLTSKMQFNNFPFISAWNFSAIIATTHKKVYQYFLFTLKSPLTSQHFYPLQKHAYSNILKILQPKTGKFPDKNYDIFHISAQNIDCGYLLEPPRRGGSNEYSQSMF